MDKLTGMVYDSLLNKKSGEAYVPSSDDSEDSNEAADQFDADGPVGIHKASHTSVHRKITPQKSLAAPDRKGMKLVIIS